MFVNGNSFYCLFYIVFVLFERDSSYCFVCGMKDTNLLFPIISFYSKTCSQECFTLVKSCAECVRTCDTLWNQIVDPDLLFWNFTSFI